MLIIYTFLHVDLRQCIIPLRGFLFKPYFDVRDVKKEEVYSAHFWHPKSSSEEILLFVCFGKKKIPHLIYRVIAVSGL